MSEKILLALTSPVAGRDAEYNAWYDDVHLADVLRVPGITWAQRFVAAKLQGALLLNYLAIYGVADDKAVAEGLGSRRGTPLMMMTDALDGAITKTVMARAQGERVAAGAPRAPANGFDRYVAVVNGAPAGDAAFDAHLDGVVLPALTGIPGVAAARSWSLAAHQTKATVTDKRVIICKLHDRQAARAGVDQAMADLVAKFHRTLDFAVVYSPRGPRHKAA